NLIKKFKSPYNILLRDDKSHVFIKIQGDHDWPRISKFRGRKSKQSKYFGPFASVDAVDETLTMLHRVFLLRSCSDNIFATRKRPCLQYHIKRCSAPCVGWISDAEYKKSLKQAIDVLEGRSSEIQGYLSKLMQKASDNQNYEQAAVYRDRLQALTKVQAQQLVNIPNLQEVDVIAVHQDAGVTCFQAFFFRNGRHYGNHAFFPRHNKEDSLDDIMVAFMSQFYFGRTPPRLILMNQKTEKLPLIQEALSHLVHHNVKVQVPQRGKKLDLVRNAAANAKQALQRHLSEKTSQRKLLEGVQQTFGLKETPKRIEVYDNSHISGTSAIGAMIVAVPEGFEKKAYRKYNIKSQDITPGDDYGMMREVLSRRFKKSLSEDYEHHTLPDLVVIDGGKGQLNVAKETMDDMGVGDIPVVSIAKGPARTPGEEKFFMPGQDMFRLKKDDPVFYYIQRLRDEAHRFAIGSHRQKRSKTLKGSMLDEVPGIGAKRKRALLKHFGSAVTVSQASISDLQTVEGISKSIAQKIFDHFHRQ
ncbi:MAG: excinuclease ABC subunit UvrC, partial [Alphaproteobacteria bacterium]